MGDKFSLRDGALSLALLSIVCFFALQNDSFLSARNLSNLMIEWSITAVLALGMLLIILPGHIDLSVGSGVGLTGGVAAVLAVHYQWPALLAMLSALLLALFLWWLMGSLIVKQNVPSFIITLGGLLVFKGLFHDVIDASTIVVRDVPWFSHLTQHYFAWTPSLLLATVAFLLYSRSQWKQRQLKQEFSFPVAPISVFCLQQLVVLESVILFLLLMHQHRGVPCAFVILLVVAALVSMLSSKTAWGRHLYAIGSNEEAAHLSGIAVSRCVISAFVVMGALTALTGLMQTAYLGASTPTIGELMELDAIAACVIGGASLKGGQGKVMGVIFGSLIMSSLLNGMTLMALAPELKLVIRGLVLALAVWMDVSLSRRR